MSDEKFCTVIYSEGQPNTLRRGWWWRFSDKSEWYGPFANECDAEAAAEAGRSVAAPTPDDTAAPYGPYTHGERRRNPYYKVLREVWRYKDGEPVELMIAKDADVTDVIHAFGIGYDLGEVAAKIFRLGFKPGANARLEFTKMHEHIQAAEDAWVAIQEEQ